MNIDHIIDIIYLSSESQQHFWGGTDFRTIAFEFGTIESQEWLFFNKIMTMLANKRLVLSKIMQSKQSCNQTYQMLGKFLSEYEDCNLTNYLDFNTNGLIFNNAVGRLFVCLNT